MHKHFPHYFQNEMMDCGPACLRMIAKHYGRHYTLQTLRKKCFITREALIDYRVSESQVSRKHHEEQAASALKIRNELLAHLITHEAGEYQQEVTNLFNAFADLNEKGLVQEDTIFWDFYNLFSTLETHK